MAQGKKTEKASIVRFKKYWKNHRNHKIRDLIEGFWDSGEPGTSEEDIGERTLRGFVAEFKRGETSGDSWDIDWHNSPDDIALQFLLKRELELSGSDGLGELRLKWIRRLKGVFENSVDAEELLLKWSNNYAKREYACISADVQLDTSDLDDCLIFRNWEDPTLYKQMASRRHYRSYRGFEDWLDEALWVLKDLTWKAPREAVVGMIRDLESGVGLIPDLDSTPDTSE